MLGPLQGVDVAKHCDRQPAYAGRAKCSGRQHRGRQALLEAFADVAIQQGILILKMGIEGGPVQGCPVGDVLHRQRLKALFAQ